MEVSVGLGRVELVEMGGDHRPSQPGDPPAAGDEAAERRPLGHAAPEPVVMAEVALDHELGEVVREAPTGRPAEAVHRPPLRRIRGPRAVAARELPKRHPHARRP
jgi:hypothetical protein